jgi:hypothetical protein
MRPALLLSTVLLLAACGGEDEKEAYVERANEICDNAIAQFEGLAVPTAPADFGDYADELVDAVERVQQDLTELPPPEEDRQELQERVLQPLSELVAEGRDFADRVQAAGGDQEQLLSLLSQRPTTEGIDVEYLREYGLDSCAEAVEQAG